MVTIGEMRNRLVGLNAPGLYFSLNQGVVDALPDETVQDLFYRFIAEPVMIDIVNQIGGYDGQCRVVPLNADGIMTLPAGGERYFTDIVGAYVGSDGCLSFSVLTPDNELHKFVGLLELPVGAKAFVYDALVEMWSDEKKSDEKQLAKSADFKKDYFVQEARELNESLEEYLDGASEVYVVLDNGNPVIWREDGVPAIFPTMQDIADEFTDWPKPIMNVSIMTEKYFIEHFCKEEYDKALKMEKEKQMFEEQEEDMEEIVYVVTGISTRFTGETERCIVGVFRDSEKADEIGLKWTKEMDEKNREEGRNWSSRFKVTTHRVW